ncbi:MAG: hypothetical protein IPN68_17410 [Bacteroidetes bacterium]|nr:hypothetical protein [Bacteroidota bacterium]
MNNSSPTKLQRLFKRRFGEKYQREYIHKFIKSYIIEQNIDFNQKLVEINDNWERVGCCYFERVEKLFQCKYSPPINVYLTTNSRCSYNIKAGYFFLFIDAESTNAIIMHELFHFYTWHSFGEKLLSKGLSKETYNDLKESLTEILNLEFSDLLNGKSDSGYIQHQKFRLLIKKLWLKSKDINKVVEEYLLLNN